MLPTRLYMLTVFAVFTWCPIPPSTHPSCSFEYSERHLLSVLGEERFIDGLRNLRYSKNVVVVVLEWSEHIH